jgi:hypothetical protein
MATDLTPGQVTCPICLSRISWSDMPKWRFDPSANGYVELQIPPEASPEQRTRLERDAAVFCPDPSNMMGPHYLPADYGRYGKPVLIGFVAESSSGKSHLLASMVGEIERGGLSPYGIRRTAIDRAMHHRFLADQVWPLLNDNRVLAPTGEGEVSFVDAFLIAPENAPKRPVALFDVSGLDLVDVDNPKAFLEIVDGLIFVVDAGKVQNRERGPYGSGDQAFKAVVSLLADRLSSLSVAVVLNKADLVRFDDPITYWWLQSEPTSIDAEQSLRESADVYAYLQSKGAKAWISDFDDCAKVTFHVASATGGPPDDATVHDPATVTTYPRGVTPRRVIAPFVSLLAMTGVVPGIEAQKVGI